MAIICTIGTVGATCVNKFIEHINFERIWIISMILYLTNNT